nr:hypothetical protein [Sphingomonas sp. Y57]
MEIYRSNTLLVRKRGGRCRKRWVVTFDHYGITGSFDRPGFGEEFLAARGISLITILGCGNDWYQYPDMGAALAAARSALLRADRVITYGSSMGGYAAIRFADALGAHGCLAVSPQYSNDPAKVPFEWRWPEDARRIDWRAEPDRPIRCAADPVIVYDPTIEDGEHVRRIACDMRCRAMPIRHAAHPATTFLGSTGLLPDLVLSVLDGSFALEPFRQRVMAARKTDPVYLCELARRQPDCRPRLGIALARRAVAAVPDVDLVHHVLATRLALAGQADEALAAHARACELSDEFWSYALPYVMALADAGERPAALALAKRLAVTWPEQAHVQHVLGHLLWLSGRTQEALKPARQAIRLAPGNAFYRAALFRYRWRYAALPAFAGWRLLRWAAHRLSRILPERRRSLAGRRPLERFTT